MKQHSFRINAQISIRQRTKKVFSGLTRILEWPVIDPLLSDKDQKYSRFKELNSEHLPQHYLIDR